MYQLDLEANKLPFGEERRKLRQQYDELEWQQSALVGERIFHYPESYSRVLPTKLGNIIAAAEEYPERLFGIDTVLMWPYLTPTLTKSGYAKYIENEKSIFDLLLNSTVLLALLGLEIGYFGLALQSVSWAWGFALLLIIVAVLILGYLTTDSVMGWTTTLRVAFVLHRNELRESLCVKEPKSYSEERELWKQVSEFLREPAQAERLGSQERFFAYTRAPKARRTQKVPVASSPQAKEDQDGKEG